MLKIENDRIHYQDPLNKDCEVLMFLDGLYKKDEKIDMELGGGVLSIDFKNLNAELESEHDIGSELNEFLGHIKSWLNQFRIERCSGNVWLEFYMRHNYLSEA